MQDGVPRPIRLHARRPALHPPRQHVRHAGGGRVPPRLHDQRALLRHRDLLDHRLRRRPGRSARRRRPLDWRSGSAASRKIRCACCAPSRSPRGSNFTIDPPVLEAIRAASPRDRPKLAAAAARGVLQDPAQRATRRRRSAGWPRRGCSSRFQRSCIAAPPSRCGDRSRRWTRIAARFESTPDTLTNPILLGSLLVPLGLPPRMQLREPRDESGDAPAARSRGHDWASCRSPGAMSSGSARYFSCSGAFATWPPTRARSARSRTAASSARRSRGSRFTATVPRSWSTGTAWPTSAAPRLPPTRKHQAIGRHANAADAGAAGSGRRRLS